MRTLKYISIGGIWLALLSCVSARAQQPAETPQDQQPGQQPSQPIPAIRSPLASGADSGEQDEAPNPQEMQPDTRSLTGVEDLSLGTMALGHSYWQPRLALSETVDSNPASSSAGNGSWGTWTSLLGGVDIHRISGVSELMLSYTGGGMFSTGNSSGSNGVIQELYFRDKYSFRRSTLSVFDQLSYLPESSFGFAGTAGAGLPGVATGGGVGSGFTPGQSILTPESQNLSNSFDVELDTKLTSRTSLTLVGGYSLLHYFTDNLLDFGTVTVQVGYNYLLSRKDTVALSYSFSGYQYSNVDQTLDLHTIQGSYGRRVTGKLAFQIAAGPQFAVSRIPVTNATPPTAPVPGTPSSSQLYWTLNTSLQYQLRRAAISASYNHGVTGGSGVLVGAETDTATGSFNDQISRTFNAGFTAGYSRNRGIATTSGSLEAQDFSYWFAGVNVAHPIGRSLDVFANYQFQYQDSNTSGCVGSACSTNTIRHQIAFGLNLHKQPLPF
jgi:hypothetical protein